MDKKKGFDEEFLLAAKHHKNNNLELAEKIYKNILIKNPNHFHSIVYLSTIFLQTKKFELAKPLIEQLIRIDPNNAQAHDNLGVINKELGNLKIAIICYEKAIKIYPEYINAYNNAGIAFKELGNTAKAIEFYQKAINLNKNNPIPYNNIGVVYNDLGNFKEAIKCFKEAIKNDQKYLNAYSNLGSSYQELGNYLEAIDAYKNALEIDPNYTIALNNLSLLLKLITFKSIKELNFFYYKKMFIFLFKKNNINHTEIFHNAKLFLFEENEKKQIQKINFSNTNLLENEIVKKKINDELFHLLLKKSLIVDNFLEIILTKVRLEFLSLIKKDQNSLIKYKEFCLALAEQCWFNEYVFFQSEEEINFLKELKKKVQNDGQINEIEIIILSCYLPLNSSKILVKKLLNYKSSDTAFNNLILTQIKEPLEEIRLKKSINSLKKITDNVSKKVKKQYEENPYPRWKYAYQHLPEEVINIINHEIKPNNIDYNEKLIYPNVLVAGCGTGSHLNNITKYKNAKITGVDLSLSSLAYAKRKMIELGFNNIDFLQADILDLKNMNNRFDIIESIGTLHHMNDPIEGLKSLINILNSPGFLKIGLYSELARSHVLEARELIKKMKFKNKIEDIRKCRKIISDQDNNLMLKKIIRRADFYSSSNVRDLIFHVQEHRFTIPQISELLNHLNLKFLGFVNHSIKSKFLKSFSKDKILSLKEWNTFENDNPETFVGMYQFWVKKNP